VGQAAGAEQSHTTRALPGADGLTHHTTKVIAASHTRQWG
jgi:hypothetical protein